MSQEELIKKKTAEIVRLTKAIKNVMESVAYLFEVHEKPSVKLAREIDGFCSEIDGRKVIHTINHRSYFVTFNLRDV